ncbi:MAG: potassium-transporting ATPase subunit KdpA [Gammaproteobacteria bacterium]|nr:potassium-transporting ATPase subunit KdpA [Gammaproteobacteria bacterium]
MSQNAMIQILGFALILFVLAKPLGVYMARVYEFKSIGLNWVLGPLERLFYRFSGVNPVQEMNWKQYLLAVLAFNLVGFFVLFFILTLQAHLPWNPEHQANMNLSLAMNTAISFVSNTNWQAYSGESSISYFTDMLGLTVQNFVSAATGMAVLMALIRGFSRRETDHLGNFWVDLIRGTLYILLPLAVIWALILMSQGVIQNLHAYIVTATQTLPMGPAASQVAIKALGTNGGGFFNANSAHPFENPTAMSNFFEMLALVLIPAALCFTFGKMVRDIRQGWVIFFAMGIIFMGALFLTVRMEQNVNPVWHSLNINVSAVDGMNLGGNMEGKEARFGITDSAMYSVATTAASNGSVNSVLDSYTPMGGMIPLFLMQLGEVVFGGVGSGLYGMLILVLIAVFISGLMVGRTPEYLGKKIEPFEMKMAAIVILIVPALILIGTAWAVLSKTALLSLGNPSAHGLTEILYAMSSMANNNGSAFAGLNANTPFYNALGAVIIVLGRYGVIIPVLAIAGSLAKKKTVPVGLGTLPTHSGFFVGLLIVVVLIIGGLTFIPSLALGPVVEQLQMVGV